MFNNILNVECTIIIIKFLKTSIDVNKIYLKGLRTVKLEALNLLLKNIGIPFYSQLNKTIRVSGIAS